MESKLRPLLLDPQFGDIKTAHPETTKVVVTRFAQDGVRTVRTVIVEPDGSCSTRDVHSVIDDDGLASNQN